jgi:magnesium-transporting ATPase (P-type)
VFDFLTFFVLLRVFGFGAAAFHTGWFIESLATQTLVLLVIRTAARPWRDRPSLPRVATMLAVLVVGIALPSQALRVCLAFSRSLQATSSISRLSSLRISESSSWSRRVCSSATARQRH